MKVLGFIKKRKKTVIAVAIVLIIVISIVVSGMKGASSLYVDETAAKRDIVTYHTFTGNITPVEDRAVYAASSSTIEKLFVEEGDEVEEGQVLAKLKSDTIEQSISEMEANIASSTTTSEYNLKDAQKSYDDYKNAIDQGLNSQLNAAKSSVDSATSALESAKKTYDNANNNLYGGTDSSIVQAKQQVDAAVVALNNAQKVYNENESNIDSADNDVDAAERVRDENESAIESLEEQIANASGAEKTALESQLKVLQTKATSYESGVSANEETVETYKKQRTSAQSSLDSALNAYNSAVESYQLVVSKSLTAVDTYYDSYITAQTSYNNAVVSYNSAALTVEQTLATYKLALEKTKAVDTVAVYKVQLENLKQQLADCTITAPISGTVTAMKLKEGEILAAGVQLASVTSFNTMKVKIDINEYDIFGAEEGKEVKVSVDALGKEYSGNIKRIAKVATVEKGVSYFESEVDFVGDDDVRSGMSVEVKLKNNDIHGVVTVPVSAVQYNTDNTAYVMVKNGKNIENKAVTVGATDGSYIEIKEGLSEGDIIQVSTIKAIDPNQVTFN